MTLNAGPDLQVKLDEVRMSGKANRHAVQQARDKVQQWCREKESEMKSTIDTWRAARESRKLGDRAQRAEDHATYAIQIVEASIDDAERMILEAISARLDESVVCDSGSDSRNWYVYNGDFRHRQAGNVW
jgi:tellurite resistance protein